MPPQHTLVNDNSKSIGRNSSRSSARASMTQPSSQHRISQYMARTTGISEVDRDQTVPALANRNFHLPGNDRWTDDWLQYVIKNNHPVFGICCHHPLHPVRKWSRAVILVGSVSFGLLVTNVIWLWFYYHDDETVIRISFGGGAGTQLHAGAGGDTVNATEVATDGDMHGYNVEGSIGSSPGGEVIITEAMIVLWTVGGALHALFDNTVWFLTACSCCLPGQFLGHLKNSPRYRKYGTYLVTLAVTLVTAAATLIIVIRAALDSKRDADEKAATEADGIEVEDLSDAVVKDPSAYRFLVSYAIELALALFVYYPIFATLLFSGIFACFTGRVPIIGGRPYEMKCEARRQMQERQQQQPESCTSLALRTKPRSTRISKATPV